MEVGHGQYALQAQYGPGSSTVALVFRSYADNLDVYLVVRTGKGKHFFHICFAAGNSDVLTGIVERVVSGYGRSGGISPMVEYGTGQVFLSAHFSFIGVSDGYQPVVSFGQHQFGFLSFHVCFAYRM